MWYLIELWGKRFVEACAKRATMTWWHVDCCYQTSIISQAQRDLWFAYFLQFALVLVYLILWSLIHRCTIVLFCTILDMGELVLNWIGVGVDVLSVFHYVFGYHTTSVQAIQALALDSLSPCGEFSFYARILTPC